MAMNDYFIRSISNMVSVNRITNGELEAIRINGDLQLPLSNFWPSFKQKIEYEADERLAFIVLTDDESFEFDTEIIFSEKFTSTKKALRDLIFENTSANTHLITFPKLEVNLNEFRPSPFVEVQVTEPELEQSIIGDNLQSFFKKQTREMQRENNKVTGGK
jgi:hypothetical protein